MCPDGTMLTQDERPQTSSKQIHSSSFAHSQDTTDLHAITSECLSSRGSGPQDIPGQNPLGVEGVDHTEMVNSADNLALLQQPAIITTASCGRHRENLKDQQVRLRRHIKGTPSNHPREAQRRMGRNGPPSSVTRSSQQDAEKDSGFISLSFCYVSLSDPAGRHLDENVKAEREEKQRSKVSPPGSQLDGMESIPQGGPYSVTFNHWLSKNPRNQGTEQMI